MFKTQTGRRKPYYPLTRQEEMNAAEFDTLMYYIDEDPGRLFEPIFDGTFNGASLFEWIIGEGERHVISERIFPMGLRRGAAEMRNPRTRDTPLHVAAKHGRLEMFRELLEVFPGAAMAVDSEGRTPLAVLLTSKLQTTANPEFYLALHAAAPECFSAASGDPAEMLYRVVCSRLIPSTAVVRLFMDALATAGAAEVPQGLIVEATHRIGWMRSVLVDDRDRANFDQQLKILRMLVEAYPSNLMGYTQHDTPIKAMLRWVQSPIWDPEGIQVSRWLTGSVIVQYCDIICRMAELCPESTKAGEGYDHSALSYAVNLGGSAIDAPRIAAVLIAADPDVFVGDAPLAEMVRDAFPPGVLAAAVASYAARRRSSAVLAFEARRRVARSRYESWKAAQTA